MKPRAVFLETRDRAGAETLARSACSTRPFRRWALRGAGGLGRHGPAVGDRVLRPEHRQLRPTCHRPNQHSSSYKEPGYQADLFTPWSALDHRQCSPAWDPDMLLLGLVIVVGADASTTGITDSVGDNLWMPDNISAERRNGLGQFAPVSRWMAHWMANCWCGGCARSSTFVQGERWTRRGFKPSAPIPRRHARARGGSGVESASAAAAAGACAGRRDAAAGNPQNDPARPAAWADQRLRTVEPGDQALGNWLRRQSTSRGPDFVHMLRGARQGLFDYLASWRLTATRLRSTIARGE